MTNGFVAGMTVQDNLFQDNTGPNAADINTPGAATPSSGILIQNNTSDADQTFAVINNTTGTQILNNTILDAARSPPARRSCCSSANPGAVISGYDRRRHRTRDRRVAGSHGPVRRRQHDPAAPSASG